MSTTTTCPICCCRFQTQAEYDAHVPCPEQGDERPDRHGNRVRAEGADRCWCGCKYWENDRCIDCGGTEPMTEADIARRDAEVRAGLF